MRNSPEFLPGCLFVPEGLVLGSFLAFAEAPRSYLRLAELPLDPLIAPDY